MEKLASRKLRLGAKRTMQIAETLYTKGFISYPRTETNIFPKELNLQPLVESQIQDSRWSGNILIFYKPTTRQYISNILLGCLSFVCLVDFSQRLLSNGLRPRIGKKSDQAHPPIHPLKTGSGLQVNLFEPASFRYLFRMIVYFGEHSS